MNYVAKSRNTEERFKRIMDSLTEPEKIESDSFILMSSFLSLIEIAQKEKGITRKELASLIKTSPSYLTQVFRGDKPLNFITLAKIQRALGIRFSVGLKQTKKVSTTRKKAKLEYSTDSY
jgi:ribosome-binding protein aMBF1 (putative translation factor)